MEVANRAPLRRSKAEITKQLGIFNEYSELVRQAEFWDSHSLNPKCRTDPCRLRSVCCVWQPVSQPELQQSCTQQTVTAVSLCLFISLTHCTAPSLSVPLVAGEYVKRLRPHPVVVSVCALGVKGAYILGLILSSELCSENTNKSVCYKQKTDKLWVCDRARGVLSRCSACWEILTSPPCLQRGANCFEINRKAQRHLL